MGTPVLCPIDGGRIGLTMRLETAKEHRRQVMAGAPDAIIPSLSNRSSRRGVLRGLVGGASSVR